MDLFDIAAKITLDTSEYEKDLSGAESKGSGFADKLKNGLKTGAKVGGVAIAAVGAGVVAIGKSFYNGVSDLAAYGDQIDKNSQKMGISAQAYQEWDFILQHSGSSIDAMGRGMMTLSKQAESNSEAFEKLGITQEDLATLNKEDLFAKTIEGLQALGEGTERDALAAELFGGSAKELGPLLNTSAEDVAAMRQQVNDLGGVMGDDAVKNAAAFQDAMQNLQTAFEGIKRGFLDDFLPSFTSVIDGLTAIFGGDSASGVSKIKEGISSIVSTLSEKAPEFMDVGFQIIDGLVMSISENLPTLIEKGADLLLNGIIPGIIENLPSLIETAFTVIGQLAASIGQALPELIPAAVSIILQIVESLIDNIDLLIDGAIQLIIGLATGLIEAIPILLEKAPEIIVKLVQAIIRNAPKLLQAATTLISTIGQGIANAWEIVKGWGKDVISKISEGISSLWADVVSWGSDIINNIAEGLTNGISSITDIGKNIISGIWEGISGAAGWLWDKISGWATGLLNGIKGLFGIASPSKVFRDQVGKWLPLGLEEGFEDEMPKVEKDLQKSLDDMAGKLNANISYSNGKNISNRMYEYDLPPERPIYLVLDSGELVGKIVQKMDVALGNENTMKLRFGGATV